MPLVLGRPTNSGGQLADQAPGRVRRFGLVESGEGMNVGGNLGCQQFAMLYAAIVGLALDMHHDPARARVTIGGIQPLD
jgi:hypothetical protein